MSIAKQRANLTDRLALAVKAQYRTLYRLCCCGKGMFFCLPDIDSDKEILSLHDVMNLATMERLHFYLVSRGKGLP